MAARKPPPLGEAERHQLTQLAADLQRAWSHPAAPAATRIIRSALKENVVRKEGAVIDAVLHWHGGDHTKLLLKFRLNAAGRHREPVHEEALSLIRELARLTPDR